MKLSGSQITLLIAVFMAFSIIGCHGGGSEGNNSEIPEEVSPKEIEITAEQFKSSGMRMGTPEQMLFRQKVMANGYIVAAPDGMAQVSTLVPARVKNVKLSVGDFVKEDQILFTIEGTEIITLQQQYAEAINELKALKSNYERQKKLAAEEITSQKELISAESSYRTLLATVEGLKSRLSMININPADVEQGRIYPAAIITSQISGYIISMDLVLGQYIQPGEVVMEVVNQERFQLNLHLFDKDLVNLVTGQRVIFNDPDDMERTFEATLSHIGRSIDPETKTILCIARLAPQDRGAFVNGLYVQAEIITCERYAPAVPSEAIFMEDGSYYVLSGKADASGSYLFHKVPVKVGVITEDHVEVLDSTLSNVLLEGAYNLYEAE